MSNNLFLETGEWLLLEDVYGVLLLEEQEPETIGYVVGEAISPGRIEATALLGG